jgi:hypothetical protein
LSPVKVKVEDDIEMEAVQVEVMSDDDNQLQLNRRDFQMFGNPEGGDQLDLGEAQRSAAFGYSISSRSSHGRMSERGSEVKRNQRGDQVIEEAFTPATEDDLQFIDETIQQISAQLQN